MSFIDFQLRPRQNLLKWIFLGGLELIYSALIRTWLMLYRIGLKKGWSADKPVISVGNITLGGTGKTPMVEWLLSWLSDKNRTPAVLTRGYKANRAEKLQVLNRETASSGNCDQFGDEPWLLFTHHPEIDFFISPDRAESARQAAATAEILVMDDGMQHLRLNRDLDIILIDAVAGIGNGHLFPLGPLREPLSSLSRADVIIYTKTNLNASTGIREQLSNALSADVRQFDSQFLPYHLLSLDGSQPATVLAGKTCILVSGIGNPEGFTRAVTGTGARVEEHLVFGDHKEYNMDTLKKIRHLAGSLNHDYLICTEKDWVKLAALHEELPPIHCLQMKMEIEPGFESFLSGWLEQNNVG